MSCAHGSPKSTVWPHPYDQQMSCCFCGCGFEFGFTQRKQRHASEIGAETTRLLNELNQYYRPWLQAGRPGFESLPELPDQPTPEENLAEMISKGETIRNACLAVAHSESGASLPSKKAVNDWQFHPTQLINSARMPLESRQRVATALTSGTGQDIFDAFQAGEKAIKK